MSVRARVHDIEEIREEGLSLEVIGGMMWFFDFLILFFLPAGVKLGHRTAFLAIMIALFLLGGALYVSGWVMRARSSSVAQIRVP